MGDPRASRTAERGQALPLFAIAFVALLGFVGLAVDGARLYAEHERVQNAADSAAIGAVHELRRGNVSYSESLLPAAIHDAGLHGVTPEQAEIIVHYPPVSGRFVQSPDHVEVVVREELPTTFMAMFGRRSQPVSGRAVAGLLPEDAPCMVALVHSGPDAMVVEGSQPFTIGCEAQVLSSDAAAWRSGETCVEASGGIALAGGASGTCIQGEVRQPSVFPADAASNLRMPGCLGRSPGTIEPSPDGEESLYWPGCYAERVEVRSGRARLMPGVHIFQGGLRISGGEVAGSGVTLLFPASGEQSGVELLPGATVVLTAPDRGEMPGVLMFAEAGGAEVDATLARGASSALTGALYFPDRTLRWAPNATGADAWQRVAAGRIVVLEGPGGRAIIPPPHGMASNFSAALVE